MDIRPAEPQLSIVIPAFNSARWLPSTLAALADAVKNLGRPVEAFVIDDGSTDETADVVRREAQGFPGEMAVVSQANAGRFAARLAGVTLARAPRVLLLDSRVLIHPNALAFAFAHTTAAGPHAWNAHIVTDADAPLIGRFWDVPTYIFWGSYLRAPRSFDLTADNFDSAPKGTTMFLADRSVLLSSFAAVNVGEGVKLVSDDTAVLRAMTEQVSIRLDPRFSAVYRPRTTVRSFIAHSFDRGTLFVDSYGGTTVLRSAAILGIVAAPIVILAAVAASVVTGRWERALFILGSVTVATLAPLVPAALNNCPRRSLLSFAAALPVFIGPFWAGLARGVFVHRRVFRGRAPRQEESA